MRMPSMDKVIMLATFLCAVPCVAMAGSPEGPVWLWLKSCGTASMLIVELKLDGQVLARSKLPICQGQREDGWDRNNQGKVAFTIRPVRSIKWTGYRDDDP